ncbi:MAG: aminotransferase class V-fold PLP-dependent enzyme [Phycisphaerales bacterium]
MELPRPSSLAAHWMHDPSVVYLNHGSFGGMPREVHHAQVALQQRLEAEPVKFFVEDIWPLMDETRKALASFLHCEWTGLTPVTNATYGVATVLDSLVESGFLTRGTSVLTNNHEYPACQNNLRRAAKRGGFDIIPAEIPFPLEHEDELVAAIVGAVTPTTRLALISHVTSPTGLVLPMNRIVRELEARNVRTLIDGAHAPGMVADLNLRAMNPSYYTANCHKWFCTPKGSAFLYVRDDLRREVHPVVLSNNAEKPRVGRDQFFTEFDFVGTSDPTPFLTIPFALRFMPGLVEGGWPEIMRRNRAMTLAARDMLCREIGMTPPAPDSMIGSICTMILPPHDAALHARLMQRPSKQHDALWDALNVKHRIQVPVWGLAGKPERFLRIACQVYNTMEQYEYLARAVNAELEAERLF